MTHAELAVRLQPRAARDGIVGLRAGRVVIRVTAPPVDGRANAALRALIADKAGIGKGAVTVVRGETSRDKVVRVDGTTAAALLQALGIGD